MNKNTAAENFSKNAHMYDDYTVVQKKCASKLIDSIKKADAPNILELGCGTGFYTRLLREKFKNSRIKALDVSQNMIDVAQNKVPDVTFNVADAERFNCDEKFDLITSNAAFQWFGSFPETVMKLKNLLKKDGHLLFSVYGPETFKELDEVISFHFGKKEWITSSRFLPGDTLKSLLGEHFSNIDLIEENFKVDFLTLWEFLKNIKRSGTRGDGIKKDIFLGKYRMREIERTYIEKFKGIIATHHVYFCSAWGDR